MQLVSKSDNSCYIYFHQAFNDKIVIAHCLVQYRQTFSSFLIFCYYFTHLKARKISFKIWKTQKKYLWYCTNQCAITSAYHFYFTTQTRFHLKRVYNELTTSFSFCIIPPIRDHPFSTYAKFSKELTIFTPW